MRCEYIGTYTIVHASIIMYTQIMLIERPSSSVVTTQRILSAELFISTSLNTHQRTIFIDEPITTAACQKQSEILLTLQSFVAAVVVIVLVVELLAAPEQCWKSSNTLHVGALVLVERCYESERVHRSISVSLFVSVSQSVSF